MISRKYNGYANVTGKEIEKLRKAKKWSRATLSNKLMILGVDVNYDGIYKIENGKRIVKDFELTAIAKVLGVSETELLNNFRESLN